MRHCILSSGSESLFSSADVGLLISETSHSFLFAPIRNFFIIQTCSYLSPVRILLWYVYIPAIQKTMGSDLMKGKKKKKKNWMEHPPECLHIPPVVREPQFGTRWPKTWCFQVPHLSQWCVRRELLKNLVWASRMASWTSTHKPFNKHLFTWCGLFSVFLKQWTLMEVDCMIW